ncbi:hypothetical protein BP00DRAFT_207385 [Aspergillus indologenus CBS 114.80]|uniref:Secreted protein n=1 Tax=Aspergillus indologenus CBS 114.80 TaxID=1450541 RepID=A0A2V5I880_9EURO|nr:hypothetical protein BP00DRAFT_207385 [Aspergillus indologenus CBS 114.80]
MMPASFVAVVLKGFQFLAVLMHRLLPHDWFPSSRTSHARTMLTLISNVRPMPHRYKLSLQWESEQPVMLPQNARTRDREANNKFNLPAFIKAALDRR